MLANVVGVSSSRRVQVVPLGVVVPAEIGVNKGFQRLKKKSHPWKLREIFYQRSFYF